ncbi:substrate-binding periplasmic protein [Marinobacter salicampi]|uniref:substrate-binding periplasmic protein n=1 Tax=Marinobacter salicampi TaxID=435907 RepID=UPI00140E89DE|nr:transporter substrate-binding domain-containing protein [Marinobacter salicampi]
MRHTLSLAVSAILLSTSAWASHGAESHAKETSEAGTNAHRDFVFNVSPTGYPPYVIISENDEYSGIIWDVVERISTQLGYQVIPRKIPRKRVNQMLVDGYIDATYRAIEWTEEPERFVFTLPITRVRENFFKTVDSEFEFEEPEDIAGHTIVTHLGFHYPALEPIFAAERAQRFDVTKHKDMLQFLLHGEQFHAAVMDQAVGQWIMSQNGWSDQLEVVGDPISDFGFRLMLRQDWSEFATAFNEELTRMKDSGEISKIERRYR